MADKRKGRKRKEDFVPNGEEKPEKPSPEEYKLAKWMKKNVPSKKTKFMSHNVEYFTGSKAVDALMESSWTNSLKEGEETLFLSRLDVIEFLDKMLRHKFFHRAKKVPVSEQELKAKLKKKLKKDDKKDDDIKKKKEDEAAESSHAEGKDTQQDETEKKKKKIRLEMHMDQYFDDGLDAYVWIYDPIPFYYWLFGMLVVLGSIAICLFPLWPPTVRMGVYYLSVAAAGLLVLIIVLAILRLFVFCVLWILTVGKHHLWLFPNLTEDVGFFASFWPLYQYEYKGGEKKTSKKKKKKDKDSDNEDDDKTEKEGDEEGNVSEPEPNQNENVSKPNEEREAATDGSGDRDSETESEDSSQQSQTGKDFEIINKEDVKDS